MARPLLSQGPRNVSRQGRDHPEIPVTTRRLGSGGERAHTPSSEPLHHLQHVEDAGFRDVAVAAVEDAGGGDPLVRREQGPGAEQGDVSTVAGEAPVALLPSPIGGGGLDAGETLEVRALRELEGGGNASGGGEAGLQLPRQHVQLVDGRDGTGEGAESMEAGDVGERQRGGAGIVGPGTLELHVHGRQQLRPRLAAEGAARGLEELDREVARLSTLDASGSIIAAELERVRAQREGAVASLGGVRAQLAEAR